MFAKFHVRALVSALLLAAILASCTAAPTATVAPTAIPTIDVRPTFDAISTQAAATVIAELTLNAPTATPVTPTDTPAPTFTPAPTDTPAPTATATRAFIAWTQTPTSTVSGYLCSVTSVSPTSSTTLKVDTDFDASWALKNTGTLTWPGDSIDVRYISGTKLHTGGDALDMSGNVAPNGTYTVTVDMRTPSSDGTYSTVWGIGMPDGTTCTLNLTINVTK